MIPSLILGRDFYMHTYLIAPVLFFTFVYFILTLRGISWLPMGWLFRRPEPNPVILHQRVRGHLIWLVLLDLIVVFLAMGFSGGLRASHLGFVLILIPQILALVRTPGKTLFWITLAVSALLIAEVLPLMTSTIPESSMSVFIAGKTSPLLRSTLGLAIDVRSAELYPRFPYAYMAALFISVALGTLQAWTSATPVLDRSVTDPIVAAAYKWPKKYGLVSLESAHISYLHDCVRIGHSGIGRVILATNEPMIHRSKVHPFDDTLVQAHALALPGALMNDWRACRNAAAMTIGMHWLDDLFDSEDYGRELSNNEVVDSLETLSERLSPSGVKRVKDDLVRRARWKLGSKNGIFRVCLGGMLRHMRDEGSPLAMKYRAVIVEGLPERYVREIDEWPPLLRWSISKTAMPVVCSMYWTAEQIVELPVKCLILDVLLSPLLLWHNVTEERYRGETILATISPGEWEGQLRESVLRAANFIGAHGKAVIGDSQLSRFMIPVIRIVWDLYSGRLPRWSEVEKYESAVRAVIDRDCK
jgi:hypothetical protein